MKVYARETQKNCRNSAKFSEKIRGNRSRNFSENRDTPWNETFSRLTQFFGLCAAAQIASPKARILLSDAEEQTIAKHSIKCFDHSFAKNVTDLKYFSAEVAGKAESVSRMVPEPTNEFVGFVYVKRI